jgi:lipopolysaccharide/colanic/teichoic acid biosynthesis glycosyltransferase
MHVRVHRHRHTHRDTHTHRERERERERGDTLIRGLLDFAFSVFKCVCVCTGMLILACDSLEMPMAASVSYWQEFYRGR